MPLVLAGATSGSTTIQATDAVTQTITLPNNTGTVLTTASTFGGTGPAFNAYATATQSITTATLTKIILASERFDTNNNFDSTTNYRFTPTVAGYYSISGTIALNAPSANTGCYAVVTKNGTIYAASGNSGNTAMYPFPTVTAIIYFNGSTDYVELYAYVPSATASTVINIFATGDSVYFQGFLARSA